jgi:long-chain acyl-CoA synthetase
MERNAMVRQSALRVAKSAFQLTKPESAAPATNSSQTSAADELPLERAYHWELAQADSIFLTQPLDGVVKNWTWAAALNEARRMAAFLQAQGWPVGSRVLILSKNNAWWIMAELAIWMSGHVTVPIYTSLTFDSARQLFDHSEPVACFLGPLDNPELLPEAIAPELLCIRFPNAPKCAGLAWDTLIAEHDPLPSSPVREANDLATIIYTSGTTGSPRGVMHRFGAFPYFAKAVLQATGSKPGQRVLSYLPLAHIAERALTEATAIAAGWHIFFGEGTATFVADLKRARPTFFFSVPRLYAKFQASVLQQMPQRRLDMCLRIPVVSHIVRRRILNELGLGSVHTAGSGSAPLGLDVLLWFRKLGLRLAEGYGTSEVGITHTAPDGQGPPGYVGRNAPEVVTRISPEGEVLVRSPMNMLGYFKDPQATRDVFTEDGFIQTGDLGEMNADGWLKINGRIKDKFKTSKGEYVCPSFIELMLNAHKAVDTSLVMGSGLPAPFAVVVLSAEAQAGMQSAVGRSRLASSVEDLLASTNARLAPHERLRFIVLTTSRWSIEAGFLTPTLKLKRHALEAHYAPMIPLWTSQSLNVVWHLEET